MTARRRRTYFFALFGSQFLSFLLSFGLITFFSFRDLRIDETAMSVGLFAIGTLCALAVSRFVNPETKALLPGLVLLGAAGTLTVRGSTLSWDTAGVILAISGSLSWTNSYLAARAQSLGSASEASSKIQFTSTLAVLLGVSLGPILSTTLGYSYFWNFVGAGLVVEMLLLRRWMKSGASVAAAAAPVSEVTYGDALLPVASIAIVWLATGFFQVYEVRLLVERFALSPGGISAVFAATLVANLAAVKLLAPRIANAKLSTFVNGALVMFCCLLYLVAGNFILSMLLILAIGVTNGLFNAGYTALLLKISSTTARERSFLAARVASQLALVASTLLAAFLAPDRVALVIPVLILALAVLHLGLRRGFARPAFALLAVFFLAAPARAAELNVLVPNLPAKLDPRAVSDSVSALIANQVFQKLYKFDAHNFLEPELAESASWSDGLQTLELKLKPGAHFSDGTPLTAADVRRSFGEIVRSQKEQIGWALGGLKGFSESARDEDPEKLGIEVVNDSTIRFRFSRPNPLFINFLATPSLPVFSDAREPLGSALFALSSRGDQEWVLKAARDSRYSAIHFVTLASGKEYDLSTYLPDGAKPDAKLETRSFPLLQTVILVFNSRDKALQKPELRCRFAAVFQQVLSDKSHYQWQPLSLGLPFSWDLTKIQSHNSAAPAKGVALPLRVAYANSAAYFSDAINEKAAKELEKKGFKIRFEKSSIQELVKKMKGGTHQVALFGYVPDYPHIDALLTPFIGSGQEYNFARYSSPKVDGLLQEARETQDKDKQNKIYRQVFDVLSKTCPVGFLGTQEGKILARKGLTIPPFSSLGIHTVDLSQVGKP